MTPASYQPLHPVVAAWSLEFAEAIGVVFLQNIGTDVNVIGSKIWQFARLSEALEELSAYPWRKRIELHVTPPDPGAVWSNIFDEAGLDCEACPSVHEVQTVFLTRELFPVLNIDNEARPWDTSDKNNAALIESINGYRVERTRQSETFSARPAHSWERYLVRALEVYALWRDAGGALEYVKKPSYETYNRGVI